MSNVKAAHNLRAHVKDS